MKKPIDPSQPGSSSIHPLRPALLYFAFGITWILLTDLALYVFGVSHRTDVLASIPKGIFFVALSGVVIYALLVREIRQVMHSENLLRAVIEGTTDAVFVKDQEGRYLLCNTAAARFVSQPVSRMLGRTDAELFDAESAKQLRENDLDIMKGTSAVTSEEILTAQGVTRTFLVTKAPYRDSDGAVMGVIGISRDITNRRGIENELRLREMMVREAGEMAHVGGWEFDPVTREGRWTEEVARIYDVDFKHFDLKFGLDRFEGEHHERIANAVEEAILHGTPYDLELPFVSMLGNRKWVRTIARPVVVNGVVKLVRGSIQDITERKRAEAELKEAETKLRTIGDNLPDGAVLRYQRWPDGRAQFLYMSQGVYRMFGVQPEEMYQDISILNQILAPEELERFEKAVIESMNNLRIFDLEFRTLPRQGEARWIHTRSAPVRQPDGSTIWDGVIFDITEQHHREQRLKQLSTAVEQSSATIVMTDRNGRMEYVNPAFTEITGYTFEEAIGHNPRILQSGRMSREFYEEMWGTLTSGRTWRGEIQNRKKNGDLYWESVSISPIRNDAGETTNYVGVKEDITERKRAEEELRSSEDRLRSILNSIPAYIGLLDPDGAVLWINEIPLAELGIKQDDVLGKQFWDTEWWSNDAVQQERIRSAVMRAALGVRSRFDAKFLTRDRRVHHIDFQIGAILDEFGNIRYLLPTAIEITARVEAERALQTRTDMYQMLARTNQAVSRCVSAAELFQELCTIAVDAGKFSFAWVGVPDGTRVKPIARAGDDQGYLDAILVSLDENDPRSQGPTGRAILNSEVRIVNDFQASSTTLPWHSQAKHVGFEASAAFPLNERGRTVAVLTLYAGRTGFFTDELVATLRELTPSVSFALDAFVRERERMEAERALRASEEQFRVFMDHGPMAAWITDENGRIEFLSENYLRMFRVMVPDPIGKTVFEMYPHAIAEVYAKTIRQVAESGSVITLTEPGLRADGSECELMVCKFPVPRRDGSIAVGGVALDITDMRRAEERLRVLGTAIDSSPNAVFIADRTGAIRWANPAFTQMSGYTLEEILGENPRFLRSGHHDSNFYRSLWEVITSGRVWTGEVVDRRKDGSEYTLRQTITPLTGPDGTVSQFVAVQEDITASKHAEARLRDLAVTDSLTGLLNRSGFRERLSYLLAGEPGALHFIDLDRFKFVNDALGHHAGDDLLRQVAERLRNRVRASDVVARFGGDEFAIVQSGVRDSDAAAILAKGIIEVLSRPFEINSEEVQIGASIGVTRFPKDGTEPDVLLKNADLAMYRAKQDGRGMFRFFTPDLEAQVQARVSLETEIRRALEREEFVLHYQPQLTVGEELVAAEALIRWNHPKRGMVPPGEFLPVAEDCGLILPMSDWVLRTACEQGRSWMDEGRPLRIAVNVSVAQVKRGDLLESVQSALTMTGFPAKMLELEITESLLLPDIPGAENLISRLHELVVKLAIDDFGTEYSSLNYLRRLPVDRLKIDRSFVVGLPTDSRDATLVRAITGLGHDLNLLVIAEGVETREQLEFLRQCGCDEVQGFLFSRPVPSEQFWNGREK